MNRLGVWKPQTGNKDSFLSETFIKMFLLKSCSQNEQVVFENHKLEIKKVFF